MILQRGQALQRFLFAYFVTQTLSISHPSALVRL